jgi:hypothetical protein
LKEFETLEDLPTDHFKMPPPYWRSSGAIFHIIDALEDFCNSLNELLQILPDINYLLGMNILKQIQMKHEVCRQ